MNKHLVWIILSITLLVVIILAGGLWLLRNSQTTPVAEATKEPSAQGDAFDITNKNTPAPGPSDANKSYSKQDVTLGEKQGTVIEPWIQKPSETVKPSPAPLVSPPHQVKTAVQAPSKTTPKPQRPTLEYWIQTGAYKSKSKADECNAVLIENGVTGRILSHQIGHQTWFRVRIGPYSVKSEAEKFLSWIKKIDELADSYISIEDPVK